MINEWGFLFEIINKTHPKHLQINANQITSTKNLMYDRIYRSIPLFHSAPNNQCLKQSKLKPFRIKTIKHGKQVKTPIESIQVWFAFSIFPTYPRKKFLIRFYWPVCWRSKHSKKPAPGLKHSRNWRTKQQLFFRKLIKLTAT